MTAFFLISGFSLSYVNAEKDYTNRNNVFLFYKKRIVSIMPMYWFMVLVYPIWDVFVNNNTFTKNLVLAPTEILGLQNAFNSLFGYTHNGGTWFVSCILFCYFIFPFIHDLINEMKIKTKIFLSSLFGLFLIYSPFLVNYLQIDNIYSNPFFRILEFVIGMLIFPIWNEMKEKQWYKNYIANWILFALIFCILIIIVTKLVKKIFWLIIIWHIVG